MYGIGLTKNYKNVITLILILFFGILTTIVKCNYFSEIKDLLSEIQSKGLVLIILAIIIFSEMAIKEYFAKMYELNKVIGAKIGTYIKQIFSLSAVGMSLFVLVPIIFCLECHWYTLILYSIQLFFLYMCLLCIFILARFFCLIKVIFYSLFLIIISVCIFNIFIALSELEDIKIVSLLITIYVKLIKFLFEISVLKTIVIVACVIVLFLVITILRKNFYIENKNIFEVKYKKRAVMKKKSEAIYHLKRMMFDIKSVFYYKESTISIIFDIAINVILLIVFRKYIMVKIVVNLLFSWVFSVEIGRLFYKDYEVRRMIFTSGISRNKFFKKKLFEYIIIEMLVIMLNILLDAGEISAGLLMVIALFHLLNTVYWFMYYYCRFTVMPIMFGMNEIKRVFVFTLIMLVPVVNVVMCVYHYKEGNRRWKNYVEC